MCSSSTLRKSRIHAHDDCVEVAQGWFTDKGGDVDLTRLESGMSFLQVKASMTMKEKLTTPLPFLQGKILVFKRGRHQQGECPGRRRLRLLMSSL
jgi:hypothetical protein